MWIEPVILNYQFKDRIVNEFKVDRRKKNKLCLNVFIASDLTIFRRTLRFMEANWIYLVLPDLTLFIVQWHGNQWVYIEGDVLWFHSDFLQGRSPFMSW